MIRGDFVIVYDRLWETMKKKEVSQYRLINTYGFSAGQLGRLRKNMHVSTHTIDVLCQILNCNAEDIMEYRLDISQTADPIEDECDKKNIKKEESGSF